MEHSWQFFWQNQMILVERLVASNLDEVYASEQASHVLPWSRENFSSSLHNIHHTCLVARRGTELMSHQVISIVSGEAELLLFVVNKPYQGVGFGACWLSLTLEYLRSCVDTVFLEVRCSNRVARALYEKVGFCEVGIRHNYYPSCTNKGRGSEDAILYAMDLSL